VPQSSSPPGSFPVAPGFVMPTPASVQHPQTCCQCRTTRCSRRSCVLKSATLPPGNFTSEPVQPVDVDSNRMHFVRRYRSLPPEIINASVVAQAAQVSVPPLAISTQVYFFSCATPYCPDSRSHPSRAAYAWSPSAIALSRLAEPSDQIDKQLVCADRVCDVADKRADCRGLCYMAVVPGRLRRGERNTSRRFPAAGTGYKHCGLAHGLLAFQP